MHRIKAVTQKSQWTLEWIRFWVFAVFVLAVPGIVVGDQLAGRTGEAIGAALLPLCAGAFILYLVLSPTKYDETLLPPDPEVEAQRLYADARREGGERAGP